MLPPHFGVDMNDGYCPSQKGVGIDIEEGSGDSEDASVSATNGFGGINLNAS